MSTINQQLLFHHIREYKFAYRNGEKEKMIKELADIIYFARKVRQDLGGDSE